MLIDVSKLTLALTLADLPRTIRARTVVDPASGCWRASEGFHDDDGYAQYHGRMAHRVIWERLVSPIEPGHVVDHVRDRGCIWRDCIWPVHLEPCSIAVNNMRSDSASARNARKTRCGVCDHEYDLLNTRWTRDGRRRCRNCESRQRAARTRPGLAQIGTGAALLDLRAA